MSEEKMYKTNHGVEGFTPKAYIISLMNNGNAQVSTRKVLQSIKNTQTDLQTFIVPATTPDTIDLDIKSNFSREYAESLYENKRLRYTWPKTPVEDGIDFSTGIYKRAYAAADWRKVAACTVSHMRMWQQCIDLDEPIVILEHDAFFVRKFKYVYVAMCGHKMGSAAKGTDYKEFHYPGAKNREVSRDQNNTKSGEKMKPKGEWSGGICGLNDPRGATRKAALYDFKVRAQLEDGIGITTVPYVDDPGDLPLPSGLAGNSAYVIKPWAAQKLLDKVKEVGIWPNDALMCRQFFPWLQQYYPYYTRVQNTPSTTTR